MHRSISNIEDHRRFLDIFRIGISLFFFLFCSEYIALAQETEPPTAVVNQTISLKDVLFDIEAHFEVSILYQSDIIEGLVLSPSFTFESTIQQTLKKLLEPFKLTFQEVNSYTFVVLSPKSKLAKDKGIVNGKITDINGKPLEGVNVILKGTQIGAPTNHKGEFEILNIPPDEYTLCASYLGFLPSEQVVSVKPNMATEMDVFLNEDFLELRNVVVTGTLNSISNIESSIALTTINPSLLEKIAPRSTADVLQYIPGFYVESSGGETTNNLFSRGMSAEGSYQYIVIQEDGLPIYEAGNVDWVGADNFVRVDLSLKKIEALRGGSGNIYASNAPGGIINFISQTGEEYSKTKGKIKLQTSDFGQLRVDGNLGGKLTKNSYFNLGGFYRRDNGIRSPGYTANQGGQLKANITRKLKGGHIRVSAKYLDDRNIFYLPIPLLNSTAPKPLSNFNANYGTMNALNETVVHFPTPEGLKTYDLKDGFHTQLGYVGTEISFKIFKNWTVVNKNRFSRISRGTDAIISVFEPIHAKKYAQDRMQAIPEASRYEYSYADSNHTYDEVIGNGLVGEQGWWHNDIQLKNLINSLEIARKSDHHFFTTGFYWSHFSNHTKRHWANLLMEVKDEKAKRLNLDFYDEEGNWVSSATHNGFTTYQAFETWKNNTGEARVLAVFMDEQWTPDPKFSVNIGGRFENLKSSGSLEDSAIYDLNDHPSSDTIPSTFNPVLANILWGNGEYEAYNWEFNDCSLSIGANYNFTPDKSAYFRATKGYRMPDFDNWQASQSEGGQIEDVSLFEGGFKYSAPKIAFFGAFFYTYIRNQLTTDASIDTLGNILPFRTRGSETFGLELEATSRPVKNFKLDVKATLQHAEYKLESIDELPYLPPIDGNQVKRIPNIFFTFMPSYEYRHFKFFGTIQHFGKRFSDETNMALLPAFTSFNLGASMEISLKSKQQLSFLIHTQNVANSIGLTEGNPRIIGTRQAPTRLARPILGRSVIASAALDF